MDDNAIKLLYINSAVHALISINQVPTGETGTGAITQPVGAGASFFISMLPLESEPGFVYLPLYTAYQPVSRRGRLGRWAGPDLHLARKTSSR